MWFLLVWGSKQREKSLGYVADYCRVCRKITPQEAMERRKGAHIWFIPVESGKLLGTSQICRSCGTEWGCHPGQFRGFKRFRGKSIDALIGATFPKAREVYRDRLAVDAKIAAGGAEIDAATRRKLLAEAFGLVEQRLQSGAGRQAHRILHLAMRPLQPTETEIRECLEPYRKSMNRMSKLSVEAAMATIYPELEVKQPGEYSY
jgi:hypothetical protein